MTSGMNLTARTWLMVFDVVYLISTYDPTPSTVTIASPRFDESESCEFSTSCRSSCSAPLPSHDHPLHSGAREQGICRRSPIQHAAIEQPPEDVLTLAPAVEPVAELIEVGLQVPGADPM